MNIQTQTHTHIYIPRPTNTHTHTHTQTLVYTPTDELTYTSFIHTYIHQQTNIHSQTHTYAHKNMHAHMSGTLSVTVIAVGNGNIDPSSKPARGCLTFTSHKLSWERLESKKSSTHTHTLNDR